MLQFNLRTINQFLKLVYLLIYTFKYIKNSNNQTRPHLIRAKLVNHVDPLHKRATPTPWPGQYTAIFECLRLRLGAKRKILTYFEH